MIELKENTNHASVIQLTFQPKKEDGIKAKNFHAICVIISFDSRKR